VQVTDIDFFTPGARLALELECLLLDTRNDAVQSRWWDSAHEALEQWRQAVRAMEASIDAVQPEAAGFKVDAERYRWVRAEAYLCPDSVEHDRIAYTIEVPTGVGCAEHTFNGAALPSLDEAIDAQIAASREQAK
jgi:formylmethanofuran:tetrahydromethanopterin formyltransferase